MVQFEYRPFTKLIVHELTEFQNDRFFEDAIRMSLSTNSQVEPSVNWINGVAFHFFGMPDTPEVVKEKLKGIIHYASVQFTRLDYRPQYPLRISNQDYHVVLRKADSNPIFVELVNWINTNPTSHPTTASS